jgi:hypothetical protein
VVAELEIRIVRGVTAISHRGGQEGRGSIGDGGGGTASTTSDRWNGHVEVVLRHFHWHCYKSSPLWFVVGGTKALVRSS